MIGINRLINLRSVRCLHCTSLEPISTEGLAHQYIILHILSWIKKYRSKKNLFFHWAWNNSRLLSILDLHLTLKVYSSQLWIIFAFLSLPKKLLNKLFNQKFNPFTYNSKFYQRRKGLLRRSKQKTKNRSNLLKISSFRKGKGLNAWFLKSK